MLTYFNITQQGESHIKRDVPCQDFSAVQRITLPRTRQELVIAAMADGVGSCDYADQGAQMAVESAVSAAAGFLEAMDETLADDASFDVNAYMADILRKSFHAALDSVEQLAAEKELPFIEFDSTLTLTVYDGDYVWFAHCGDDGIVALYRDGSYEMITRRHKDPVDPMYMIPFSMKEYWQFGRTEKKTASYAMMTDGVLDHCVDIAAMNHRVYFPFLRPALTSVMRTEEDVEAARADWDEYLGGSDKYPVSFRTEVTDDITFVIVQNPDAVADLPEIIFDFDRWQQDSARRKREVQELLFADYREYRRKLDESLAQEPAASAEAAPAAEKGPAAPDTGDPGGGACRTGEDHSNPRSEDPALSPASAPAPAPAPVPASAPPAAPSSPPVSNRPESTPKSCSAHQVLESAASAVNSILSFACRAGKRMRKSVDQVLEDKSSSADAAPPSAANPTGHGGEGGDTSDGAHKPEE